MMMNQTDTPHPQDRKVLAIVQARMSSSRLPGKVMKKICGRPMLQWVVQRARRASCINQLAVAITTDSADDILESYCREHAIEVFRGSPADVLDRFVQAGRKLFADVIVRLTADCPLIDPGVIEQTFHAFTESNVDFAANRLPPPYKRTFPIGLDVEIVAMAALEKAWREAAELYQREHVMPYIYQHPDLFKTRIIDHAQDYGMYRWTVDTAEDLLFIRTIAEKKSCQMDFGWLDVIDLLNQHPGLMKINANIKHKSFLDVDERIKHSRK